MRFLVNRCRRFEWLLNETEDRPLQADEHAFMEAHRRVCVPCERLARGSIGLNMLRDAAIDVPVDSAFGDRVIRRLRIQESKAGLMYWSPAVLSGAIAGLAILAAIQMVSRPEQLPVFSGAGDARKVAQPVFPELKEFSNPSREP